MLRRRIVGPLLSTTGGGLQAADVSKRHTRQSGNFQQFCYLPPGSHAPRMPWICEAPPPPPPSNTKLTAAPHESAVGCAATKATTTVSAAFSGLTQLDTPLETLPVSERVAHLAPRVVAVEAGGVLHSTAAQSGPLRATSACRMPALAGPTLDTRIGDILELTESLAAEMLPDVVRLLIDSTAEGVENVSLSDFAAMQPKRQLAALGGKKAWHEWLIESAHYKQVARLELESPFYDLRALRQAGITTLYQWAEQPDLVKVSAYTRSLLDAAVEKSVETYVEEVVKVVNTSNQLADVLVSWAADVIGKFILDTLHITVEQAAAQRGGAAASAHALDMAAVDEAMTGMAAIAAMDTTARPGMVCTLEHFYRLAKKVLASVRKEYMAQRQLDHGSMDAARTVLDSQAEAEIREKAYTTLSDALLKVLEAQAQNMPKELHPLRDHGFLALERLPGLLRQAASVLQLQNVPVRHFVFHSTGGPEIDEVARNEFDVSTTGGHTMQTPGPSGGGNNVSINVAAPTLMSGVFLTGTANYNVTLGEWSGYPQPNSTSSSMWTENTVQNEYFSLLHRLKRHTVRVARTSLFDVIKGADEFRNGFSPTEALGLQQLLGTAKLVEDRLASVLNCHSNASSTFKPVYFVEAGHSCGKTSMLGRLSKRMLENGKRSVIVRYGGAATPFTPGLDDHPLAFSARFWFRVALASCPYLVRTEELFTRAPKSVMWWANRLNWSWDLYQKRILLCSHPDGATSSSLHAIFVDDVDRALGAMESRMVAAVGAAHGTLNGTSGYFSSSMFWGDAEEETKKATTPTRTTIGVGQNNNHNVSKKCSEKQMENTSLSSSAETIQLKHHIPFHPDVVEAALAKVTVAVGQLDMVFTGHYASKLFLNHVDAPVRRYFIPLSNGIGLQQRLRVFPLVSALYALHQRSRLEFSGLMYEVLKNCPGLLGHILDVFWSGRAALMDLRGGAPRLMQWSGTHPSLRSYVPAELFAELPQRNYLLQNLPEARLRLVELLQRQLSNPTGYLATGVDTTAQDEREGLVVPYNHTTCQVHPFALFTIFTHQDLLESPREPMVVRAWGEVWAEYCAVVNTMGTTSERKRDALRVLLHGALLLRVVAVSGVKMDLNMKIPPYGFPLLASPTRVKQKGGGRELVVAKATADTVRKAAAAYKTFFMQTEQTHIPFRPSVGLNGGCDVVSISGSTLALYDLVTTHEALQDINYRFAEALLGVLHCLGRNVLPQHKIRQIHYVSVVSIDQTTAMTSHAGKMSVAGGTTSSIVSDDVFAPPPASVVPYFLDLSAVFEDNVIDRLRALQETLDIGKEFRTLNDLLDELEGAHNVHVHQDVVASQEELESLLSTTLMQLVPDATVLPAYTAEVISPDTLLMDLLVDDEEEESFRGAEVEELHRDTILAKEVLTPESFADAEHVQESAELLEALLNESFVDTRHQSAQERATNESTQAALLTDIATEDAINNNMPVATDVFSARQASLLAPAAAHEDALAWLHDIVTPARAAAPTADPRAEKTGDLTVTTTLSGAASGRDAVGSRVLASPGGEGAAEGEEEVEEVVEEEVEEGEGDEGEEGEDADDAAGKQAGGSARGPKKSPTHRHRPSRGGKGGAGRQRPKQQPQGKAKKSKKNVPPPAAAQAKRKTKKTKKSGGKTNTSSSTSSTASRKKNKRK